MTSTEDLAKTLLDDIEELMTSVAKNVSEKKKLRELNPKLGKLKNTAHLIINSIQHEMDFGSFLTDIGDSIIKTQQNLDTKSKQYLKQIKQEPHIQPAIFRIPKVSAEIKFALSKIKGKGFNVIFAKKKSEEETSLNQSLNFEILSVPPPPDFQQSFYDRVPSLGYVFTTSLRAAIFEEIKQYKPRESGENRQSGLSQELILNNPDKVLILQIHPHKKDIEEYILLYADKEEDKNVGVWYLQRGKETTFEAVLKFGLDIRTGENYKLLRDFVIYVSRLQQNILV